MKKINKICPICSVKFSVPFCHRNRYRTCGYVCGGILRRKQIIKNICENCKIEFISKKSPTKPQRFCSVQCGTSVLVKGRTGNCRNCGKEMHIPPHKEAGIWAKKSCSKKCRAEFEQKRTQADAKPHSYRKRAWRTFQKKCYDCGYKEREDILVIHHIDGNRKNGKLENLIPVCQNCHCIRHIIMNGNSKIPSARIRTH